MTTQHTPKQLLTTLAFSGLAFLLTGLTIQRFAASPAMTVLIDRSYCPATQWQTLTDKYARLYWQHQRKQVRIERVIFFSDLSQSEAEAIPTPATVQTLKVYGQHDSKKQSALEQNYPNTRILSCRFALY